MAPTSQGNPPTEEASVATMPPLDPSHREVEFKALRDEILKRLELESQLFYLVLLAAGTLLTLGAQAASATNANADSVDEVILYALLVFPLIVMFLAASWAQHDLRIGQIRTYIREELEPNGAGWENYRKLNNVSSKLLGIRLGTLAARGSFVSTQAATLTLAITHFTFVGNWPFTSGENLTQEVLIGLDVLVTLLTIFLVWRRRS